MEKKIKNQQVYFIEFSERDIVALEFFAAFNSKYEKEITDGLFTKVNCITSCFGKKDLEQIDVNSTVIDLYKNVQIGSEKGRDLVYKVIQQIVNYIKTINKALPYYKTLIIIKETILTILNKEYSNNPKAILILSSLVKITDCITIIYDTQIVHPKNKPHTTKNHYQKQLEDLHQNLENNIQQLEATNKELENFSYIVSHDLKAPLRAIDGFSKVLAKKLGDTLSEKDDRYLRIIIENTEKMNKMIDDLLLYSRINRIHKRISRIDINYLVDNVIYNFKQTKNLDKYTITVHNLANIEGDREMIKLVISNLLNNAIKFSSKKEHPLIKISAEETENEMVYSITDNGVGFDQEYVEKVFDIFQRLHSNSDYEGNGIGLAIVKRVLNNHGGRIWAIGEIDNGAAFYFSLPKNNHAKPI